MKTAQIPTISFCHKAVNCAPNTVKSGTSPFKGFGVAVTNMLSTCILVLLKGFSTNAEGSKASCPRRRNRHVCGGRHRDPSQAWAGYPVVIGPERRRRRGVFQWENPVIRGPLVPRAGSVLVRPEAPPRPGQPRRAMARGEAPGGRQG